MNEESNYGWHIETTKYVKGDFLLGANFNTNDGFGKKESYFCFYLGKFCITVGKFHKW